MSVVSSRSPGWVVAVGEVGEFGDKVDCCDGIEDEDEDEYEGEGVALVGVDVGEAGEIDVSGFVEVGGEEGWPVEVDVDVDVGVPVMMMEDGEMVESGVVVEFRGEVEVVVVIGGGCKDDGTGGVMFAVMPGEEVASLREVVVFRVFSLPVEAKAPDDGRAAMLLELAFPCCNPGITIGKHSSPSGFSTLNNDCDHDGSSVLSSPSEASISKSTSTSTFVSTFTPVSTDPGP